MILNAYSPGKIMAVLQTCEDGDIAELPQTGIAGAGNRGYVKIADNADGDRQ